MPPGRMRAFLCSQEQQQATADVQASATQLEARAAEADAAHAAALKRGEQLQQDLARMQARLKC